MNELFDPRLGWQPDIYQRYSFLAKLTDIIASEGSGALTLLDIGSGPIALTRAFVSPRFDIVRADVGQFDDPSIVQLRPGEPLPFADGAFDVAIAIEVLEHVPPAQRPAVIRELQRVSRQATIVCCPVNTPEVVEAERQFSACAKAVSGNEVDFLEEHRENGLPDVADIVSWFHEPGGVLVAENAPLDEWLVFNALDFIYACDFGDVDVKRRFSATVNAQTPLSRAGATHYRRFFCAFTSPAHSASASDVITATRSSDLGDPQRLAREVVAGMLGWREDLRERSRRELEAARRHLSELDAAVALKDVHIGKLDNILVELRDAANGMDASLRKLEEHVAATDQNLQDVRTALAEKDARLQAELETSANAAKALASARAELATQGERIVQLKEERARLRTERATAVAARARARVAERQLQAILKSGSWRLTTPLRRLRTVRTLLSPAGGFASFRQWLRNRIIRGGRDYALVAESGLFDRRWYRKRYPDVDKARVDPLVHYLERGAREGRDPNPLFDSSFYLRSNPDVAAAGVNPLVHYLSTGGVQGRSPHPDFDGAFYLASNPEVAAAGVNPLIHYLRAGAEGRVKAARTKARAKAERARTRERVKAAREKERAKAVRAKERAKAARVKRRAALALRRSPVSGSLTGYVPPHGRLPWFNPLNLVVAPQLLNEPRLNVLVPGLRMVSLSGGPNTALEIAGRLALLGVRVRLISTEFAFDEDLAPFRAHMRGLLGTDLPADVELVSANDRAVPMAIGGRDLFMATAWWTAQQAKYAVRQTLHPRFIYLIQDYEPLFHPSSTQQALAEETYSLDHLPIVNSQSLREFLARERIGRFADPAFVERSLMFQPAVDRTLFFPALDRSGRARRRLLFYARPTGGLRNLFELGVAALEKAVADGTLDPDRWEFVGMGEPFESVPLGSGATLVPAPWLDLAGYAQQMRDSDILLSLMLSPHTSYPPLEMAACGGLSVTTTFANKTAEVLAGLSANIIGTAATLEDISEGLAAAVARVDDLEGRRAAAAINLPSNWASSLAHIVPTLFDELLVLQGSPLRERKQTDDAGTSIVAPGFRHWPRDEYEVHRLRAFARRRTQYPSRGEPGLISLLTPVWNTPPEYLEALADSVLNQDADAGSFEWVVLDNGSDNVDTRATIERLRRQPVVRYLRSERNLGIIEGTRFCLEHAVGRYTATVDHDDLLTPDCIRVVSHALAEAGYPALAYTDEDSVNGDRFSSPYFKPSFDPVLFANSCYIAHLSIVDRQLALQVGAYTETQAEGSHDWDTFVRFLLAGYTPTHIPEVLYSWRMHEASTSSNIHSKPFVYDSQRHVLTRLVAGLSKNQRFLLERSPLFGGTPDWWMRRDASTPRPVTTVVVARPADRLPDIKPPSGVPHDVVRLDPAEGVAGFARLAARAAESGRLLHVLWHDTRITDDVWALEAMGLFELFRDTTMVGGRLHRNGRILTAGAYFGFGRGCDAPDRGRPLGNPGYHAQAWKQHSVSAVSLNHSVLDPSLALDALSELARGNCSLVHLGAWLGAAFRRQGRRVIYSPYLSAETDIDLAAQVSDVEHEAFKRVNVDLMPDPLYLPRHIMLHAPAYQPASTDVRRRPFGDPGPALTDGQMLEADRMARAVVTPASSAVSFSILTSVYSRTPAQFFELTARSLLEQRYTNFEWIVLENGPVPDDVTQVLDRIEADQRVQRFACGENAGIQGAMRQCLARATRRFVIPLDADDVLEPDALEVLAAAIDREQADFVFSDEDHLNGERMHTPYVRPGFDPVLNLESSYIWHLCAFNRERALELGVYSDQGAEYCHDWDTVVRFGGAGLQFAHVPHVLYHWRMHANSQSHTDTQNPGSLASMRAVIEGVLARRGADQRYEITEFPLFRGAVEWWIRRRPIGDPSFAVMVLGATQSDVDALAPVLSGARHVVPIRERLRTISDWRSLGDALPGDVERIVLLDRRCRPTTQEWVWEATKWFELQPDVAIVGGRILDDRDVVVDAGSRVTGGETVAIYKGFHRTDAGAFALALKPQTVDAPAEGFLVLERRFLMAAIESITQDGFSGSPGATLGALAKEQHRRTIYSPLVEARRIRIPRDDESRIDDMVLAQEESQLAPRAQEDVNPASQALLLIAPTDWQHVGTRPEFKVRTSESETQGEVLLFGRDDYFKRGIKRAACVASVRLEPGDVADLLVGIPAAPLPEGNYVVVLKGSTGEVSSVSGVCISEATEHWPRQFQAMLAEQARFAVGDSAAQRPLREGEPLFSISTAVHNVDPAFLVALADSILSQRYQDFEWILLDNGSDRPDTQQVSRELAARDPRVRFWRSEDNLHIVGGSRFLLEQARGTYVVPVDHDDVLYPDALRILSSFVAEHEPDLLYSDEQKITSSGVAAEILWRAAWSNLAALSTCPAAHLMAFKRTLALEAELYSSDYARGSPDWDSALRLATRTSRIVHVPFVLYGWRMHQASTAINENSKNYLAESQKSVVTHALERLGLADRFEVVPADDVGLGYYHAVRRQHNGPRVLVHAVIPADAPDGALSQLGSSLARMRYEAISYRIYLPGQTESDVGLTAAAARIRTGDVKPELVTYRDEAELQRLMFTDAVIERAEVHVFLNPMLAVTNADSIWEAIGTFELDPSAGIAGGCIVDPDGRVCHIGYMSGLDGFFATPAHGQDMRSVHGQLGLIRRNVTAVYGSFMAVKRDVLRTIGGFQGIDRSDGLYGIEFCLRAARHGIKTAYSPRMQATLTGALAHPAGHDRALVAQIVAEYPAAGALDPYYSRHCIPRADAFGSAIVDRG